MAEAPLAERILEVDEQAQAKLFEPFQQERQSQARLYGGTGLGLAITKTIAEAMGGAVLVRSSLGEGSTFTLTVPRVQGETRQAAA